MKNEKEIFQYLLKYGNTKRTDLINYSKQKFNFSQKNIERSIKKMVTKGEIYYVLHNQLKPPQVYLSLHESSPPEVTKILLRAAIEMKKEKDSAKKILKEASSIADQKNFYSFN